MKYKQGSHRIAPALSISISRPIRKLTQLFYEEQKNERGQAHAAKDHYQRIEYTQSDFHHNKRRAQKSIAPSKPKIGRSDESTRTGSQ